MSVEKRKTIKKRIRLTKNKPNFCDLQSSNNENLHTVSVHEGDKPFKCNLCDKSFASKTMLNNHIASTHEEKKPYRCDICDKSFKTKSNMKTHYTSVHEGKKTFHSTLFINVGSLRVYNKFRKS